MNGADVELKAPKDKKNDITDDIIQDTMGSMGKYQLLLTLLAFPSKIPTVLQPLGIVFLAPPVRYTCLDSAGNSTLGVPDLCPCERPQYDRSIFEDTIVMSWDLICDRQWMVSFNQTIFMLGILVGSIFFGAISDRYGRRRPLLGAAALELVAGVAAGLAPEFWSFVVFRFFIGASVGGIMIINFVLLIEFTGKGHRELSSCLVQLPFNCGYLLLPVLGYYIRTWQNLQIAFSVFAGGLFFFYWFLPDTPRWLLAAGRTEDAIVVLKKAAKINGYPTHLVREKVLLHEQEKPTDQVVERGTLLDLFRTPNIRRNMICISVNWMVCSLGFFGVAQYIGHLSGDIFINNLISAALNTLGTLVSFTVMKLLNRKTTLLLMNIGTSLCLFAIAVTPDEWAIVKVILACMGNVGMFVVFVVVYLYTTELFPTVVRNAALGIASMLARVGSMIAPFVVALSYNAFWIPPVILGTAPLVAAALVTFIPETKGCNLPNTILEGEQFGMRPKMRNKR